MKRYYFIIHFLPKEANSSLLLGRCISVMHGFICRHNIEGIGVSLPSWSSDSIGNTIAFVHSDPDVLSLLKQQAYFVDMYDCGFFQLEPVTLVPDSCKECKFKRNQSIAKRFIGDHKRRLKRHKKRAVERGEEFKPNVNIKVKEFDLFHSILMSSHSNQQEFILHIQRESIDIQSKPSFSPYGFATNEKFNGTVPDLSSLITYI